MIPDRSQLLTEKQWEAFIEEGPNLSDADIRTHKSRARKRIRRILRDFAYLFPNLPADDRKKIFSDLDAWREHREAKRAAEERAGQEAENSGRVRAAPVDQPDQSPEAEAGEELYTGICSLLAFIYAGIDDREEFADMMERSIAAEREAENRIPLTVDVSITLVREDDVRETLRQFKEGEVSDREVIAELEDSGAMNASLFTDVVFGHEKWEVEDDEE